MNNVHRICFDKQNAIALDNCLVYSFGFYGDWSFEELMEQLGCRVYVFDHKLTKLGDHQHSPNITFYLISLFNQNADGAAADIDGAIRLRTFSTIYDMLVPEHGEKIIDYLKIEPEFDGDEWDIIPDLLKSEALSKVRQMEILVRYDRNDSKKRQQNKTRLIESLERFGFVRFSSVPHLSGHFLNFYDYGEYTAFKLSWFNSGLTRKL